MTRFLGRDGEATAVQMVGTFLFNGIRFPAGSYVVIWADGHRSVMREHEMAAQTILETQ